ncbi:MAG: hypothetical protein ACKO96_17950, partial [Flammeovirgaceae bacterium]
MRDVLHGPIAGAIVVGASSLYITYPLFAIISGFTGGLAQSFIQNFFEKGSMQNRTIISTVSWSLFG